MGKILGTTRYCLAMTGTFIGGYADHLFPLLIRMAGREMKEHGFQWGSKMPFVERYGCIDRIVGDDRRAGHGRRTRFSVPLKGEDRASH